MRLLIVCWMALAAGAVAGGTPPPGDKVVPRQAESQIGIWFDFDDSRWGVGGAVDYGRTLPSGNEFITDAKTTGRFIVVRFNVQNKKAREDRILSDPELVDDKGRRFRTFDRQRRYLPSDAHVIAMEALPSGVERDFWAIYEIAADADGLAFEARSLSAFGERKLIRLGKINRAKGSR